MEKFKYDYFLFRRYYANAEEAKLKDRGTVTFTQKSRPTVTEIENEVMRLKYPHLNQEDYIIFPV